MEKIHTVMIIPPDEIVTELSKLMWTLNSRYGTSKAAVYKPHITLKSLGKINDDKFRKAIVDIADITEKIRRFQLHMEGLRFYGSNKNFLGIYIPVQRSDELFGLHKKLVMSLRKYDDGRDRRFKEMENWNPHLTLVGDDIKYAELERAKVELNMQHLSEIFYDFYVNQITMYRHTEEGIKPAYHWYIDVDLL